ncbi:MAG: SDR family NAD(P)-dependent oxidoreductase, partial [Melioribacteraceae bacterium]|nr:SDR family NAD(P)-dependent oxidoreductase [Melioribacteraceae bacterium]
ADVEVMKIDLSDLSSVKSFADEFINKYDKLDILINNAGVMMPPYSKTKDGFELQFGTNHLGHFALTLQLLDLIKKTPDSRIVNVSSTAHNFGSINFDDLN